MFDIGWSEMVVILVVALIVIGPRDLPRVARTVGRWVGKGRALAREFQNQLEDMARETELDTVRKEIEKVGRTNVKRSLEKAIDPEGDLGRAFDPTATNGAAKRRGAAAPPPEGGKGAEPAVGASDQAEAQPAPAAGPPPAAAPRERVPVEPG